MTRILAALSQVAADYDVLYCDLWGCLHDGKAPFPDAVAALRGFRAGGGKVLLLTNAPQAKVSRVDARDNGFAGLRLAQWDTLPATTPEPAPSAA